MILEYQHRDRRFGGIKTSKQGRNKLRQRVITAIVALLIFIPIIIMGGIWIDIAALALGIVAISEILVMKRSY